MASSLSEVVIVAGGSAQQLMPARLGRGLLIIKPLSEDCWVSCGGTAAVDTGELVYSGKPATFTVERFPEIGGAWTVYSATTGAKITVRET